MWPNIRIGREIKTRGRDGKCRSKGGLLPVSINLAVSQSSVKSCQANNRPLSRDSPLECRYTLGQGNARYMLHTVSPTENFHVVGITKVPFPYKRWLARS